MSKWRPTKSGCLFVIPDIHGQYDELQLIFDRILPLRKNINAEDKIVFLGDYVDRGKDSHKVLDRLIDLKKEYKDQIVLLRGNHESMFLDAMKPAVSSNAYQFWMKYGGVDSLAGYLERANYTLENPYELMRSRIKDFVPKEHIDFINDLKYFYETDEFVFVHGGCNPTIPLEKQEKEVLIWDRNLYTVVSNSPNKELPWDKVIVTGHNSDGPEPLIRDKFMMLDCSGHKKLIVYEMHSKKGFVAKQGNDRLVKLDRPLHF